MRRGTATFTVDLHPSRAGDALDGVRDHLNACLVRYVPVTCSQVTGWVLAQAVMKLVDSAYVYLYAVHMNSANYRFTVMCGIEEVIQQTRVGHCIHLNILSRGLNWRHSIMGSLDAPFGIGPDD